MKTCFAIAGLFGLSLCGGTALAQGYYPDGPYSANRCCNPYAHAPTMDWVNQPSIPDIGGRMPSAPMPVYAIGGSVDVVPSYRSRRRKSCLRRSPIRRRRMIRRLRSGETTSIGWAKPKDADALLDLLCAASQEIGLADRVCDQSQRAKYLGWMQQNCRRKLALIARDDREHVLGLLLFDGIQVISYVVVSELHRGKGIGQRLVTAFLDSGSFSHLRAEARNERSRRMFENCGFEHEDDNNGDFPVLVWRPRT